MRSFNLQSLSEPLAATLHGNDAAFDALTTDSRSVEPGQLFVALQGPRFDGHDFVEAAADQGASAALVSDSVAYSIPSLQVGDTTRALGRLAALNRQIYSGALLAITGSTGKTTVKNLLASILERSGPTLSTQGNLNNEIGVPLTLSRLTPQHSFAVVEMGAARAGDIEYLCELARPTIAMLLNAMPAHLQGFASVEGVARAKAEIFAGLDESGIALFNADSPFAPLWRQLSSHARQCEFGFAGQAQVSARDVEDMGLQGSRFLLVSTQGEVPVRLRLPGRHNITNALAAAAAALMVGAAGTDIVAGLESVANAPGRLSWQTSDTGAVIIDDTYNANPGSVKAAIDLLATSGGARKRGAGSTRKRGAGSRRVLVLGVMGELGEDSERLHEEVGVYARECGISELWCVGAETEPAVHGFGRHGHFCEHRSELTAQLVNRFGDGDTVLVKGSRSAGMELVAAALLAADGRPD